MTKQEIEKLFKKAGFQKTEGGRHEVWKKEGFPIVVLPRHRGDISKGTVSSIHKKAGIKQ
jgi:predicted RNA binding protein YcfA (HicA-like mRNA interferase family)